MTSTIASRVKAWRAKRRWTQAELAARLDQHPSWVSQVETGQREPNARNLAELAGVLGCRTDELLPPVRPKR